MNKEKMGGIFLTMVAGGVIVGAVSAFAIAVLAKDQEKKKKLMKLPMISFAIAGIGVIGTVATKVISK